MNGKGDTPRPYNGKAYRAGFEAIRWSTMKTTKAQKDYIRALRSMIKGAVGVEKWPKGDGGGKFARTLQKGERKQVAWTKKILAQLARDTYEAPVNLQADQSRKGRARRKTAPSRRRH